jgi:hypothetical protein
MKGSLWRWIVGNTQFDPLWLFRNSDVARSHNVCFTKHKGMSKMR